LVDRLAVFVEFALEDAPRRWSAQVAVRLVDVSQQVDIGRSVMRGELGALIGRRFHPPAAAIRRDQPRRLRPAQAGHACDVKPHQTLAWPVQAGVLEPHQRLLHPTVDFLAPLSGKPHFAAAGQKCPNLLQAPRF
jgi:hypothetical protein